MKKRLIRNSIVLIFFIILFFSVLSNATNDDNSFDMESWGKYLNNEYQKTQHEGLRACSKAGVYEEGDSVSIMDSDIKRGTAFYQAQGMNKEEAQDMAVDYAKESETLYNKAIEEGYSVTEDEIEKYITGLREELASETIDAESKKQLLEVIGQFEKEEDYWDYQKQVYAKLLPVQKYVSFMEKKYFEDHPGASDSEWMEYFENYKKELVKREFN